MKRAQVKVRKQTTLPDIYTKIVKECPRGTPFLLVYFSTPTNVPFL